MSLMTKTTTVDGKLILFDSNENGYCISKDDLTEISSDMTGDYVIRNDQKYRVENKPNGEIQVIGREIDGSVQNRIKNPYFGSKNFNILQPSDEREAFYAKIDMEGFIHAMLAFMLFRSQDGKLSQLNESNILFIETDKKTLAPVWIDLDETLPPNNTFSKQNDDKGDVHVLRNGLMALPQARQLLSEHQQKQTEQLIISICNKRRELLAYLTRFSKGANPKLGQENLSSFGSGA